jgi:hypothetical protein
VAVAKLGYMLGSPGIRRYSIGVTIRSVRTISREVFVTPQRLNAELPLSGEMR